MKLPEIIGISGTNGAGKDTLAEIRHNLTGAEHVSLSDILRLELDKRNLPKTRSNLEDLSAEWRRETGDYGTLATRTIEDYMGRKAVGAAGGGISIVSVRHPDEARRIQENDGKIIWVDGDPLGRYTRIQLANRDRIDDEITYSMFCEDEEREKAVAAEDSSRISVHDVEPLADMHIENNFDTRAEYIDYLMSQYFSDL